MTARIYRPAKTAMQSGQAKSKAWVLDFEATEPRSVEPLMGWTSSGDMLQQVKLTFETKDAAIAYAQKKGMAFRVIEPKEPKRRGMAYSDNFRHDRMGNWTH